MHLDKAVQLVVADQRGYCGKRGIPALNAIKHVRSYYTDDTVSERWQEGSITHRSTAEAYETVVNADGYELFPKGTTMARFKVDDYRLDAAMLLNCSRRQLLRMARRANDVLASHYACYHGLTREETETAARARRDDAFYMLEHKGY